MDKTRKIGQVPDLRDSTRAREKTALVAVQLAALCTLFRLQTYFEQNHTMLTPHEANELVRLTKWWEAFGKQKQLTLCELAEAMSTEVEHVSKLLI